MFAASPLKRLRQLRWLAGLPDTINVPALPDRPNRAVPIEHATVDDIEFTLVALTRRQSEIYRLTNALEEMLKMARYQGARGVDTAIVAAARDLEDGR